MKKNIAILLLSMACVGMFAWRELYLNNAFAKSIVIDLDDQVQAAQPGDSIRIPLRIRNNSWGHVSLLDKSASCGVVEIMTPAEFDKKRVYEGHVTVVADSAVGLHSEQVVLRTDGDQPFVPIVLRYRVEGSQRAPA